MTNKELNMFLDEKQRADDLTIILNQIKLLIRDCEEVQNSNESKWTKKCAKLNAYNEIKELLGVEYYGDDN